MRYTAFHYEYFIKYLYKMFILTFTLIAVLIQPACRTDTGVYIQYERTNTTIIAAIGDSLTWGALAYGEKADSGGYPAILENLLRKDGYDIVVFNKGIPGEKAFQTRNRFEKAIADTDIVLLMIGVNDIIRPRECPEPDNCRTIEHIKAMIMMAQRSGVRVLLSTVLPAQSNCDRSWANEPIQDLNRQIHAYAHQYNLPLVDNHYVIKEHGGNIYSDCLHLTDEGYHLLARSWYHAITHGHFLNPW